jgi:hypothetical protein
MNMIDKWDGKTIPIQRLSKTNAQWLRAHNSQPHAVFKLTRNDQLPTGQTSAYPRYDLTFNNGDMVGFWKGVWLMEHPGKQANPVVSGLPEWKDDQDSETAWANGLDHHITELRGLTCAFTFLQGYLPIVNSHGTPNVDRVRMLYLDQAITMDNGEKEDLILVVLAFADNGGAQEDGAGGGPPH